MVNHFRTLILNQPPLIGEAVDFAEYIEKNFIPVRLDGVEEGVRAAIFDANFDRNRQEFISTMLFRLILDFEETARIANEVDSRISFDPRTSSLVRLDAAGIPTLIATPGDPLAPGDDLDSSSLELGDSRPIVPKISQIWQKIASLGNFRAIFTSSGAYSSTLSDLSRLIDTLKRDDHRLATVCCAYGLRITERL
jgi:hypothetical protein